MPNKLSILLLTEDTGDNAHAVLRAVVEKLLFSAFASLNLSQIEYERADEQGRQAMGFNGYKSTNPDDYRKQLDLAQTIATKLLRKGMEAFIFVHVDGDRVWSQRGKKPDDALCENQGAFERNVLRRVRNVLASSQNEERLKRILMVMPFWSIEAWLYQNQREVQRICNLHAPRHDRDRSKFKEWADEPAKLDEVRQPKTAVPTFKDKYNLDLALSLPSRKIHALGLSFTNTVHRLQDCAPLVEAISGMQRGS